MSSATSGLSRKTSDTVEVETFAFRSMSLSVSLGKRRKNNSPFARCFCNYIGHAFSRDMCR